MEKCCSACLFVCQMNHKNRSKWNYISCENGPSFPYKRTNERKILDIKKRFQKVTNDVAKTFSGNQKFRKRDLFVLTSSSTSSRCRFPWYSNNFSMHSIALTTKKDWKNTTKTSSKNECKQDRWIREREKYVKKMNRCFKRKNKCGEANILLSSVVDSWTGQLGGSNPTCVKICKLCAMKIFSQ